MMDKRFVLLLIIGCLFALCVSPLFAPKAYFWINDRGETKQEFPDVCRWTYHNSFVVWQDARAGDYDIWGQALDKDGKKIGPNICLHPKNREGDQKFPSIACRKDKEYAVVVWQHENKENGTWDIFGQLISVGGELIGETFEVNALLEEAQMYPAVAFSRGDYFTVCWQDDRKYGEVGWDIYARTFFCDGSATPEPITSDDYTVNDAQENDQVFPDVSFVPPGKSRAEYLMCFAWEHYGYADDNPTWDIVMRRWTIEGGQPKPYDPKDSLVVDQATFRKSHSRRPAIGSNENGHMIFAWEDDRTRADPTIYFQVLDVDLNFVGGNDNKPVTKGTVTWTQVNCDAMSRSDGDATVVWSDYRNVNWDVFAQRINLQEGSYNGDNWPVNDPGADGNQRYPAVDRDDAGEAMQSITWMDNRRSVGMYDIYFRIMDRYNEPVTDEIEISKLFGGTAEFDDDEDYDIPATPTWNEDPFPWPSIPKMEAAQAFIHTITKNDIDGYWSIFEADTFPERKGKSKSWVDDYDVVIADLGWRNGPSTAGQLTTGEQDEFIAYLTDTIGRVVIIGNDFGNDYDGTALYNNYFSIKLDDDGNPWAIGNVEYLNGQAGTFTEDMKLEYRYTDTCDNYVDNIAAINADMIFQAENPQSKVFFWSGGAYSFAWGAHPERDKTVHLSFSLSGIYSETHPHTSIELVRRMMAWLDQRVAPEPVTTLRAYAGTNEGEVRLTWKAPWNQSVPPNSADAASGYTVKFTNWEDIPPHYGKMTDDDEFNAANTYYQTWTPEVGGTYEDITLRGLPPATPLIFALKGYDVYSGETRNATLGDEPMATVKGDLVTPHSIYVGHDASGGGYVRDFLANEIMDIRLGDTLWFTWDASNLYVGYARNDWTGSGDFYVFFDVETGGADSTYPEQSGKRNSLPDDFHGDYCFRVSTSGIYGLHEHSGSYTWNTSTTTWGGNFSEDDVVNSRLYTEFSIPFANIGYNPNNPFKFLAICQNESNNNLWNSFPLENGIGKATNLNYYYYFNWLGDAMSPGDDVSTLNIELSAFTATCGMDGIELVWRTESEEDIYQWAIEKREGEEFVEIGRLSGAGNAQGPTEYRFLDSDVVYGHSYTYRLSYITVSGKKEACGTMTVPFIPSSLKNPHLYPISPNPVRSNANATFLVTKKAVASLKVYDLTGRIIQTVFEEEKEPGLYTATVPFKHCAQGVYFIEFQCEGERMLRKVTLLR
jgi:hypothetical protein